jgi:hypothetical protein
MGQEYSRRASRQESLPGSNGVRNQFRIAKLARAQITAIPRRIRRWQLARILLSPGTAPMSFWLGAKGVVEMRRVLSLAIAGLFVLLVSAVQAQAQTITFNAPLHGGNEVPGVVTGSAGTAVVTWNPTTKAGTYRVDVFNMPVGTTASHIHTGAPGVAGPVVVNFAVPAGGISNDYALVGTFGCSDVVVRAAQGINSCDDFEQALLLGNMYVNVHSTANPGGEIRGQLARQ